MEAKGRIILYRNKREYMQKQKEEMVQTRKTIDLLRSTLLMNNNNNNK